MRLAEFWGRRWTTRLPGGRQLAGRNGSERGKHDPLPLRLDREGRRQSSCRSTSTSMSPTGEGRELTHIPELGGISSRRRHKAWRLRDDVDGPRATRKKNGFCIETLENAPPRHNQQWPQLRLRGAKGARAVLGKRLGWLDTRTWTRASQRFRERRGCGERRSRVHLSCVSRSGRAHAFSFSAPQKFRFGPT
jgi:hypothetical protein